MQKKESEWVGELSRREGKRGMSEIKEWGREVGGEREGGREGGTG